MKNELKIKVFLPLYSTILFVNILNAQSEKMVVFNDISKLQFADTGISDTLRLFNQGETIRIEILPHFKDSLVTKKDSSKADVLVYSNKFFSNSKIKTEILDKVKRLLYPFTTIYFFDRKYCRDDYYFNKPEYKKCDGLIFVLQKIDDRNTL